MLSLDSLAKVILSIRDDVSNKKLQKLAYYVYAWYLTIFGVSIAEMRFEAWEHGPVCRKLYSGYKRYGWKNIPEYKGFVLASDEDIKFVESVLTVYGGYTAGELEEMTHNEAPWQEARQRGFRCSTADAIITEQSMITFYSTQSDIREQIETML